VDPVALAREFERCRLGEQSDPAPGRRIEQIVRRADEAGDGSQVNNGAAVRAVLPALALRTIHMIEQIPLLAFPAKAGIHFCRGHRLSPVKRY
jgi:hypothetical protein